MKWLWLLPLLALFAVPALQDEPATLARGAVQDGDLGQIGNWTFAVSPGQPILHHNNWPANAKVSWNGEANVTWWISMEGTILGWGNETEWTGTDPAGRATYATETRLIAADATACLFATKPAKECWLTPTEKSAFPALQWKGKGNIFVAEAKDTTLLWAPGDAYPFQWNRLEIDIQPGAKSPWIQSFGPTIELEEMAPWGITDPESRFPAREAYMAAATLSPAFQAWQEENPFHVVSERSAWQLYSLEREAFVWYLTFVSEESTLGLQVTKNMAGGTIIPAASLPDPLPFEPGAYEFGTFAPDPQPSFSALPKETPSGTSLVQVWQHMTQKETPSSVSYAWNCEETCALEDLYVAAFTWRGAYSLATPGPLEKESDSLRINGTGSLQSYKQYLETTRHLPDPIPSKNPAPVQIATVNSPVTPVAFGATALLIPAIVKLILGLFSRTRENELLKHPSRRKIHATLQATPGLGLRELARSTEIPNGALTHHLKKLMDAKQVLQDAETRKFLLPKQKLSNAHLWNSPTRRKIQAALESPCTPKELGAIIGLSRSAVHAQIANLEKAGLVKKENGVIHRIPHS